MVFFFLSRSSSTLTQLLQTFRTATRQNNKIVNYGDGIENRKSSFLFVYFEEKYANVSGGSKLPSLNVIHTKIIFKGGI